MSLVDVFLTVAKPDTCGVSREVSIIELVGVDARFACSNGGSWCRDDAFLSRGFLVKRGKDKNKIISVATVGLVKERHKRVLPEVVKLFKDRRCVVLGCGGKNIEIDHKNGRYDEKFVTGECAGQCEEDFQAMHRAVNICKREHCKKCRKTGLMFNARVLGFPIPTLVSDLKYKGDCTPCYWYDPPAFVRKCYSIKE
jgi:hypothetical protein